MQTTPSRARAAAGQRRLHRDLVRWYRRTARDLPWRRTRDPYAIWISETMLQQTTVGTVIPYYERFLARYPDVASLAGARDDDLLALWSGLGYYRRARNLRAAAALILARHGGRFPSRIAEILALPGIGRYTAGAIASIGFAARVPVVDGNVARVLSRFYGVSAPAGGASAGPLISRLWRIAAELVPANRPGDWNQALMELGATTCRPATPACGDCPLAPGCRARRTGNPLRYDPPRRRPPATLVRAALVVIERERRILLVRRPDRELLGGLFELPGTLASALRESARSGRATTASTSGGSHEAPTASGPRPLAAKARPEQVPTKARRGSDARRALAMHLHDSLGFTPRGLERSGSVRHSVTYRRLTIDAWRASAPARLPAALAPRRADRHLWANPGELGSIPLGAASRKVLLEVMRGATPPQAST